MNNIFLGGDPLLTSPNYDVKIAELQQMQRALEQQRQQLMSQQPEQSGAPVWEAIEKLTAELSDKEFTFISQNEDFVNQQTKIAEALNAEYMKMMRPIVERNHRPLLEEHLRLLKDLRKEASKELDKRMALFNEYVATNPDIPFSEFLKTKQ